MRRTREHLLERHGSFHRECEEQKSDQSLVEICVVFSDVEAGCAFLSFLPMESQGASAQSMTLIHPEPRMEKRFEEKRFEEKAVLLPTLPNNLQTNHTWEEGVVAAAASS